MKAAEKNDTLSFKGTEVRVVADISSEALKVRKEWVDISKVLKENINCQAKLLYPAKVSFKNEGEIKTCLHEKKKF